MSRSKLMPPLTQLMLYVRFRVQCWWVLLTARRVYPWSTLRQVKFYGGLYRAQLAPTIYTESNNQYLGFDNKVHEWGPLGNYHSVRSPPILIVVDVAT
mgnify:CR=1 FL=1